MIDRRNIMNTATYTEKPKALLRKGRWRELRNFRAETKLDRLHYIEWNSKMNNHKQGGSLVRTIASDRSRLIYIILYLLENKDIPCQTHGSCSDARLFTKSRVGAADNRRSHPNTIP